MQNTEHRLVEVVDVIKQEDYLFLHGLWCKIVNVTIANATDRLAIHVDKLGHLLSSLAKVDSSLFVWILSVRDG